MKALMILFLISLTILAQVAGNEVVVLNSTPFGKFDGIQKDSSEIYVVINDTSDGRGSHVRLFISQDTGKTFNPIRSSSSITKPVDQLKLLKSPANIIYAIYSFDSIITIWNLNSGDERTELFSGINGWDATFSARGTLHLFYSSGDSLFHYYLTNGTGSWKRQSVTPNLSHPQIESNSTLDTFYLSSYLIGSASIPSRRNIMLSQLALRSQDTLQPLTFTSLTTDSTIKTEYSVIPLRNYIHLIHTVRSGDSMDLFHAYSWDRGFNISSRMPFAATPNYQEYWFDYDVDSKGNRVNVVFYADSLQPGQSTIQTDMIMFSSIVNDTIINLATPISNYIPYWHPNEFKPKIFSVFREEENQAGVLYAGIDSSSNAKIFFKIVDYNIVVAMDDKLNIVNKFILYNNYPNPFNPTTEIRFNLPEKSFVKVSVFDILGNEVEILLNSELTSGEHRIKFNAENLTSGMYVYKLEAGNYKATGKMLLLK